VIRLSPSANARLDDIFRYTLKRWGAAQAERYVADLFDCFERIARGEIVSRPVPPDFGVTGFYARHASHIVYWRRLANGDIGIVTVLHERMHQIDRFRDDLG